MASLIERFSDLIGFGDSMGSGAHVARSNFVDREMEELERTFLVAEELHRTLQQNKANTEAKANDVDSRAVAVELANALGIDASERQINNAVEAMSAQPPKSPEHFGLTDQQSDILAVLDNLTQSGGEISPARFYFACRAAGATGMFEMKEAERVVGKLGAMGLVDVGTRKTTELGAEVAESHKAQIRDGLLANIEDARTGLENELTGVREWRDPQTGNTVSLSNEGMADYLEAINVLSQAELAIKNKSTLMVDPSLSKDSLGGDIIEKLRDDMSIVGANVIEQKAQVREKAQENKNEKAHAASASVSDGRSISR